ncbi:TniQ family protein [Aliiglaciecola sp. M165]|nr:TniQ family protein [Aliiglaciecola sp. M165]
MSMLLIRTKPFLDESLESYLLRLSIHNGYNKFQSFWAGVRSHLNESTRGIDSALPSELSKINICHANVSSAKRLDALRLVSQLTNHEPLPLLSLALFRGGQLFSRKRTSVFNNGVTIPFRFLRTKGIPICPACIKENVYIRQHWHFSLFEACPEHSVLLRNHCDCGEEINYLSSHEIAQCAKCGSNLADLEATVSSAPQREIAHWLSGRLVEGLPAVIQSHSWGICLWWQETFNDGKDIDSEQLHLFLAQWPDSLRSYLNCKLAHSKEYALKPFNQLSFKDVFGLLLIQASRLPSTNLSENIVLKEIVRYLEEHVFEPECLLSDLKLNSIEAAIILGTSVEQIAVLVDQGELQTKSRMKANSVLNANWRVLSLGDVFCLWLAKFQTDNSHSNVFISRW